MMSLRRRGRASRARAWANSTRCRLHAAMVLVEEVPDLLDLVSFSSPQTPIILKHTQVSRYRGQLQQYQLLLAEQEQEQEQVRLVTMLLRQ